MNVLLAGGTGFIGQKLTKKLLQQGYHVYILTRNPKTSTNKNITYIGYNHSISSLPSFSTVINLAGESLFGYWTIKKKEAILNSRIDTTQFLIKIMKNAKTLPKVFINGSAVGFYGMSTEKTFTEKDTVPGSDFLAQVVFEWEQIAQQAELMGIRTVYARFGVVLGKDKGAFPMMSLPVKLYLGGKIGKGNQWISWIHVKDAVNVLLYSMNNKNIKGPLNVTAPDVVQNKEFMKTLAKVMNRPYWFPMPAWIMLLTVGEMSQLVTKGQHVYPEKLNKTDFKFSYPTLEEALSDLTYTLD